MWYRDIYIGKTPIHIKVHFLKLKDSQSSIYKYYLNTTVVYVTDAIMNVRDTLKLLNRQRADIWWQWIQCGRWPSDTEHSHRRSTLAFPRWEAEYHSGRSLISHTPAQWLCLSFIWWLKDCGTNFHPAVVFRNTQRPQAAVESAACHCAEGSGAHVFHQLPCVRSRESTRLLAGQSSAFSVGGEHTAGSTLNV